MGRLAAILWLRYTTARNETKERLLEPRRLQLSELGPKLDRLWALSAQKIDRIEAEYDRSKGSPVFTVGGSYTTRGWTEWTEGFQYGSSLLQFDATGEKRFLELGKERTLERMARHVSHTGVHDHGFNNISTYGNLLRLAREGRSPVKAGEADFYELALKVSGAVQAARWTDLHGGLGYIYSFNGPHSLFADTIRTLRSLAVAHQLGHRLFGENDREISLLRRLVLHAAVTARYIVYYGAGRDSYDIRGRTAHEAIFNVKDGNFRAPSTQQGYSPFSTWTRGLAWIITGYAEELECLSGLPDADFDKDLADLAALLAALGMTGGRSEAASQSPKQRTLDFMLEAVRAAADFYIENTARDGVPYWDTGAPGLARLGDWRNRPADPFNDEEPVDSSAAAIAGQGLLRLGAYLAGSDHAAAERSTAAGLTTIATLLDEPYLSTNPHHQGLLLHSIYHRPNGWDFVPPGARVPRGESSMWGDYHLREAALYVQRRLSGGPYLTFFLTEERR